MPEPSRLFLITPIVADAARFAPLLEAAVGAADVACLRLRVTAADPGATAAAVRTLAPLAQRRGAAVLVDLDARFAAKPDVARLQVDGIHVDGGGAALAAALAALRPDRIVGAGGFEDRDAAMQAGEAGADYVMFGAPDGDAEHARIVDDATWWAEIFNVPCVAYATRPDRVADLAATGAEFVALCESLWDDVEAIAATVRAAALALAPSSAVSR